MAIIRAYKQLGINQGFTMDLRKYTKILSLRVVLEFLNTDTDFPNNSIILENFDIEGDNGIIYSGSLGRIHAFAPTREYFFRLQGERVNEVLVETGSADAGSFLSVYIEVEIQDSITFRGR